MNWDIPRLWKGFPVNNDEQDLSHDGVVFLVEESWITISLDLHLLDEWLLIDDIVNEQCIKQQQYDSTEYRLSKDIPQESSKTDNVFFDPTE